MGIAVSSSIQNYIKPNNINLGSRKQSLKRCLVYYFKLQKYIAWAIPMNTTRCTPIHTYVNTYIYFVWFWMCSGTEKWLLFERRKVAFFWRDHVSNLASQEPTLRQTECPIQTEGAIEDQAKNLNSTAHPDDERTFIHICGLILMLWQKETHLTHKKDRYIIVYRAGIELSTSRLRQHRQLPVVQHVRFMF